MTKTIKSKVIYDEINEELDDGSKIFENGTKVYKVSNDVQYKGSVIKYNPKTKLYQIEYEDCDQEEFYHNEIHAHNEHQILRDKRWKKTKRK